MTAEDLPSISALSDSIKRVMTAQGGRLHFRDMDGLVSSDMHLSPEALGIMRMGKRSEFAYRMAWARQKLKHERFCENEGKGLWRISQ